jgi:uncharacterized protein
MPRLRRTLIHVLSSIALLLLTQVSHAACDFDAEAAAAPNPKSLKILLIGASGMIGSRILKEATRRGHCVIGGARNPDRIAGGSNVRAVMLDATDKDAVLLAARKADVIVSATSPRESTDLERAFMAVADAEIAAAKATGKRLLMVGSAGTLKLPDGRPGVEALPEKAQDEGRAMLGVLVALRASDVDWTFFCPPVSIAPGKRTGSYRIGTSTAMFDTRNRSAISAEDFAYALMDELESGAHRRAQMTVAY